MEAVIITGTSRGIGFETAKICIENGYFVYGISRSSTKVFNDEFFVQIKCDLANQVSLDQCINFIFSDSKKRQAKILALVNNAAYAQLGAIDDVPVDLVRKQFETNVFGLLYLTKKIILMMKEQKEGKIINISSLVGKFVTPFRGIYAATKHSIEALSDAMQMELKSYGIMVVVVNAGYVETNFHKSAINNLKSLHVPHSIQYESCLENHMKGISPVEVAKLIFSIIKCSKPRGRYVIGKQARLILLLRKLLPESIFYSLVKNKTKMISR